MKKLPAVAIVSARRTPMGAFQGVFSGLTAPQLGSIAIKAAVTDAGVDAAAIDEVYFGNVVSAGIGQAPARQASLGADIPDSVPCTTVSKVCGSGMKAAMIGADQIRAGQAGIVVAGGMESMSNTPYVSNGARSGLRLGHSQLADSLFRDGLEDFQTGKLMGNFGQAVADQFEVTRAAMDEYAIESLTRANRAISQNWFRNEIAAVTLSTRSGEVAIDTDEQPSKAMPEKIPLLKPAFAKDGTVTAANSSSISDGAAALLLMDNELASAQGITPLAHMVAQTSHARAPSEFCLAPIGAIQKVLDATGWQADDVDLFEVNEAFAVVSMLAIDHLGLDHARVNIHGGACALGHPLGASGARIIVTLIHALRRTGGRRGIAALCIGGGEATAVAVEIPTAEKD